MSSFANGRRRVDRSATAGAASPASFPSLNHLFQASARAAMFDSWFLSDRPFEQFDGPQLGATRRRIAPGFLFARPHDVPGEQTRPPFFRHGLKTALDLAVLERHETHDHYAASLLYQSGNR